MMKFLKTYCLVIRFVWWQKEKDHKISFLSKEIITGELISRYERISFKTERSFFPFGKSSYCASTFFCSTCITIVRAHSCVGKVHYLVFVIETLNFPHYFRNFYGIEHIKFISDEVHSLIKYSVTILSSTVILKFKN